MLGFIGGKGRVRMPRLNLEELETRLTPSSVKTLIDHGEVPLPAALPFHAGVPSLHVAVTGEKHVATKSVAHPAAAPVPKPIPTATIDFKALPGDAAYKVHVTFADTEGNTFTSDYNIGANTSPEAVRDLVYASIPQATLNKAGWLVQKSGTTIITISGYSDRTDTFNIQKVGAAATGVPKDKQIGVSAISGVKRGQTTDGSKWKFTFLQNPQDGTSVLLDSAVAQVSVDGVTVSANLSAGMTPLDAAVALQAAMVSAGIGDAVLDGSSVVFLHDTTGQEALNVSFTLTGPSGGSPVSWFETDVTIAQRTLLP